MKHVDKAIFFQGCDNVSAVMNFVTSGDGREPTTGDKGRRTIHANHSGDAPLDAHSGSLEAETMATMDLSRISFLRKETQKRTSGLDLVDFIITMAT